MTEPTPRQHMARMVANLKLAERMGDETDWPVKSRWSVDALVQLLRETDPDRMAS